MLCIQGVRLQASSDHNMEGFTAYFHFIIISSLTHIMYVNPSLGHFLVFYQLVGQELPEVVSDMGGLEDNLTMSPCPEYTPASLVTGNGFDKFHTQLQDLTSRVLCPVF